MKFQVNVLCNTNTLEGAILIPVDLALWDIVESSNWDAFVTPPLNHNTLNVFKVIQINLISKDKVFRGNSHQMEGHFVQN